MAVGTRPTGKMLEYEQYIDHRLTQTRAKIKSTDVVTAVVTLITVALGLLLLEVVLDHALGLPFVVRAIVLVVGLIAGLGYFAWAVVRPLVSRVSALYAARTIEQADPDFKNSLITYLDLRRRREEIGASLLGAVESRAVGDLTRVETDAVVNQTRLTRAFYALMAVVVLFCLYVVSTPKSIPDSVRRALLSDVARPTRTRLINVKPGDDPELSQVVAGSDVRFSAEVDLRGIRPDAIALHASIDGGRFFNEIPFEPGKNLYDPWKATLPNVQVDTEYYLTGGDAVSKRYRLTVLPAPMVVGLTHDLQFPEYTGIAPRLGVEGGNVRAIEGTQVTVHAKTNQPARSAEIELNPVGTFPARVGTEDPRAIHGSFRVSQTGSYKIHFETEDGKTNPDPVVYDVEALKDLPPSARFLRPVEPTVQVPANGSVTLQFEATDDFGVREATLHVRQGDEILRPAVNYLEGKDPVGKFAQTDMLDLVDLKVKPGARIEYWLAVRDSKQPQSNRVLSDRRVIEVIEPVSQEELDRRRQEEEQQAPPPPPAENQPVSGQEQPTPPSDPDQQHDPQQQPDQPPQDQPGDRDPNSQPDPDQAGDPSSGGQPDNAPPDQPLSPEDQAKLDRLRRAAERLTPPPPQDPSESEPEKSEQQKGERGEQQKGEQQKGERAEQQKGEQGAQQKGEQQKGERGEQQKGEQGEPREGQREQGDSEQKGEGQLGVRKEAGGDPTGREAGEDAVDQTTPTPTPEGPPPGEPGESVAPRELPADGGLNLRKVEDLLKDEESAKRLEQETGMSRQEMEQFVRRFEKPENLGPAGPGGEREVKPGTDQAVDPNAITKDTLKGATVSSRSGRGAGMVGEDAVAGNRQGARSIAPPEVRARFDAYRRSLSRSAAPAAPRPAAPANPPPASR